MNERFENLIANGKLAGLQIFVKDEITVIALRKNGKIASTRYYKLSEIKSAENYVAKKADKASRTFSAEFSKWQPVAYQMGMEIVTNKYSAYLVAKRPTPDYQGPQQAYLECPYSKQGIDRLSDYLGDAFAQHTTGESLPQPNITVEPEPSDLPTGITLTKELAEEILALWDGMSSAEQQELSDKRGQKLTELIQEATGILQQHD